ncbi:MAG: hypothetical protein GX591_05150 [Planctomycetes bacterium]|mgnify:CR=1 FL=1|nr:hypothetical protein [Planctomycetota bacterium]
MMQRWTATWDGALIEVRFEDVPFSKSDASLGRYPTGELLVDGVSLVRRASDSPTSVELRAALRRPGGGRAGICARVRCGSKAVSCDIRIDNQRLNVSPCRF